MTRKANLRKNANIFSRMFFCWMLPLFWKGMKRDLVSHDLGSPLDSDLSEPLGDKLEISWFQEIERCKKLKTKPRLLRAIAKTFICQYILDGLLVLIQYVCCKSFQPLLLALLLGYFTAGGATAGQNRNYALAYAGGVVALSLANVFIQHHTTLRQQQLGMRIRIACCSLIYRKILRLSTSSLGKTTAGQVVNLLSNDVNRFDSVLKFLHIIWVVPIQIALCCYLYYHRVSSVALLGVAAILLQTLPVQSYISRISARLRFKIARRTDERVRLMDEIICGIQVIKMYAWEWPFEKAVKNARKTEMANVSKASCLRAVNASFLIFAERTSLYVALLGHALLGHVVDASTVYSLAQLYNMLQTMLAYVYPNALTASAECLVSIRRIQDFLLLEETDSPNLRIPRDAGIENLSFEPSDKGPLPSMGTVGRGDLKRSSQSQGQVTESLALELRGVYARWSEVEGGYQDVLSDVSLKIRHGKLYAIIGSIGAGKSSLLQLLLRELAPRQGTLHVNGTISYSCQEPWLFVATIRNNILFGQPYDPKKYREVVRCCALEKDFEQFPRGDQTLVGERGVSLSGGQRARINLARAVYRQADIYLLDDPLSGVDGAVANHLFHCCMSDFLRGKTRILVTHQLHYLKSADFIIVMNNSTAKSEYEEEETVAQEEEAEVIASGRMKASVYWKYWKFGRSPCLLAMMICVTVLSQMSASSTDYWVTYWTNQRSQQLLIQARQMEELYLTAADGNLESMYGILNYEKLAHKKNRTSFNAIHANATNQMKLRHNLQNLIDSIPHDNATANLKDVIKPNVNNTILYTHIVDLLAYLINKNTTISNIELIDRLYKLKESNVTLQNITHAQSFSKKNNQTYSEQERVLAGLSKLLGTLTTEQYLYVYTAFVLSCIVLSISSSVLFFRACVKSSQGLHDQVFSKILRARMRFFDTNSSGRILNRFSKDLGSIDELLPKDMMEAVQIIMFVISAMIMVSLTNLWLLIPAAGLLFLFYLLITFYLSTAQDIKRLEGITRSPVFSHTCASIKGISTIRSSKAQYRLAKEFDSHQDLHTTSWYQFLASRSTLGFWLDIIGIMFVACVSFSFIIFDDGTALSGNVGLAISQSLILTSMLQFGVRQATEVVSHLTSVERVLQYTDVEQEKGLHTGEKPTPQNWPSGGSLTFKHVFLSYCETDRPVLEDLSVHIKSGWKVGIVGRTGAGKSSLIAALFRLAKVEGSIIIDGLEMKNISLQDLRSNISIIPQEPILFSSSMRHNLDPFEKYDDASLWSALESVDLKDSVPSLDYQVSEGGSNFSLGQRQLVCLARAILTNNQILVLDEVTANMDPQTDHFIQQIIREKFSHCTVLTIAHRLNTIMDADRVLVMDAGRAAEFGHPHLLLRDGEGYLFRMVQETGVTMGAKLQASAQRSYNKKRAIQAKERHSQSQFWGKDDESISYGSMSDEYDT